MNSANTLTGSSILAFNPQRLWRKTFASRGPAQSPNETKVESAVASKNNRLVRNQALYFSEPDDVRKCIENLVPDHCFCLILTNRLV